MRDSMRVEVLESILPPPQYIPLMTSRPRYMTPTKASVAHRVCRDPDTSAFEKVPMTRPSTRTKTKRNTISAPSELEPTKSLWRPTTEHKTPSKSGAKSLKLKTPRTAPKRLYLIRHGQSQGQVAKRLGMDRQRDQQLRDADLTQEGVRQAQQIANYNFGEAEPDLVVSSPLTRALRTAILGFPNLRQRILIHYDLAEVGSRVPENTPRPIHQVLKDLETTDLIVDVKTLLPDTWPTVLYDGKNNRGKAIQRAMQYLYAERVEETIVVVCHFNVIRQILEDGANLSPLNAIPIACELYANGQVKETVVVDDDDCNETRKRLDYS